jgi:hypothetical protein
VNQSFFSFILFCVLSIGLSANAKGTNLSDHFHTVTPQDVTACLMDTPLVCKDQVQKSDIPSAFFQLTRDRNINNSGLTAPGLMYKDPLNGIFSQADPNACLRVDCEGHIALVRGTHKNQAACGKVKKANSCAVQKKGKYYDFSSCLKRRLESKGFCQKSESKENKKDGNTDGKDDGKGDGSGDNGPGDGSGDDGSGDGSGDNGPGDNGPGDNGPGDNGPGDNGPGDNGPGDNGPGDNGPGDNGPGDDGTGDDGTGDDGTGDDGTGDDGTGDDGTGDDGSGDDGKNDGKNGDGNNGGGNGGFDGKANDNGGGNDGNDGDDGGDGHGGPKPKKD